MRLNGWKRLAIFLLGLWWSFWLFAFFAARSQRNRAIAVDEAVSGEKWTPATLNPVVTGHQVDMNQAMFAILIPLIICALIFSVRWVIIGFRKQG